jgi:hypothetical protein
MSCPTGVPDAVGAVERFQPDDFLEICKFAFRAPHMKSVTIPGYGDSG